ncbi:MAG: TetR/AcrR family transcriptional regulator [Chloroflexota bacterium]
MGKQHYHSANIEREDRILDAASELILHYGFDKTTVSDIARAASVSKGAIYLHFDSKETLVDALVLREIKRYTDRTLALLEADESQWAFIGMYQSALRAMTETEIVSAMARADERVFGSYLRKTSLDLSGFKRRTRLPLLRLLQGVGAIRQDADLQAVDYILSLLMHGALYPTKAVVPEQSIPFDRFVAGFGEMMERWLVPEDGGNWEEGRRVLLKTLRQYRDMMDELFDRSDRKVGSEEDHG